MIEAVKTIVFRVVGNYDTTEGRGGQYTRGWYLCREIAQAAAKGNYVMGTDCPIEELERVVVQMDEGSFLLGEKIDTSYEDPRVVRARALAKLTDAERAALGLEVQR